MSRHLAALNADVLHGHGAKGGAFVRLMSAPSAIRVYTPHGGSLHYGRHTLRGMVYGAIERFLMRRTELFLFESAFARDTYQGHGRQRRAASSASCRTASAPPR